MNFWEYVIINDKLNQELYLIERVRMTYETNISYVAVGIKGQRLINCDYDFGMLSLTHFPVHGILSLTHVPACGHNVVTPMRTPLAQWHYAMCREVH